MIRQVQIGLKPWNLKACFKPLRQSQQVALREYEVSSASHRAERFITFTTLAKASSVVLHILLKYCKIFEIPKYFFFYCLFLVSLYNYLAPITSIFKSFIFWPQMNFAGTFLHQFIYCKLLQPAALPILELIPYPPSYKTPIQHLIFFFFFPLSSILPGSCQHTFTLKCVTHWQLHKICDVHLIPENNTWTIFPERSIRRKKVRIQTLANGK